MQMSSDLKCELAAIVFGSLALIHLTPMGQSLVDCSKGGSDLRDLYACLPSRAAVNTLKYWQGTANRLGLEIFSPQILAEAERPAGREFLR